MKPILSTHSFESRLLLSRDTVLSLQKVEVRTRGEILLLIWHVRVAKFRERVLVQLLFFGILLFGGETFWLGLSLI
jgi:hypothetical protein